jgi:hypothetical protein
MKKLLSILFLLVYGSATAQVTPEEGSLLHYRLIGFSVAKTQYTGSAKLEIAQGIFYNEDSFAKNIIISKKISGNRIIAEVPFFSEAYTWRFVSAQKSPVLNKLYHFSTYVTDTNRLNTQLRIITPAALFKDAYIFLDETRTLYDMNGQPVWRLPFIDEIHAGRVPVRDMKITPQGTITFVVEGKEALEIDYNGTVLWKGPNTGEVSNVESENYHHELTRLNNGHYMVLGSAPHKWQSDFRSPDSLRAPRKPIDTSSPNKRKNPGLPFGTIIEYDETGKVTWFWKSAEYFSKSDLRHYRYENGRRMMDVHLNSFYFDENAQAIYASFKNISRIVKIKYPEGTVLNEYGEIYRPGMPEKGNNMFCYQHACKVTADRQLCLFNNNSCHPECSPEIVVIQEPQNANEKAAITWTYDCPVEPLTTKLSGTAQGKGSGTSGGNVMELPGGHFFASLCAPYGLLFIVNKDKQVVWSAQAERWNPTENAYRAYPQYRASIISSKEQMEQLIWNAAVERPGQ